MMRVVILFVLICEALCNPTHWWTPSTTPRPNTIPTRPPTNPGPYTIPTRPPISQGKGSVDTSPQFLSNNYIPAAMHVLFHLSDMMKYEVRPQAPAGGAGAAAGAGGTTSTTVRPTQPHKPGNYAPETPQGPAGFYSDQNSQAAWSFGWGKIVGGLTPDFASPPPLLRRHQGILPADLDLFGAGPFELLHQINNLEDTDTVDQDDDIQIEKFSINYEDTVNLDFLRQKRVPPTKAFVNVLSLFDLLNKESKELGLNKFNGYSESMLRELMKTSEGTSSEQLKFVLSKVVDKRNTKKDNILRKIKQMLIDLEKPESYISTAIRYIPALQFSL